MHGLYTIAGPSFDSFLASLFIGSRLLRIRGRMIWAAAFGVCDYVATAAGAWAHLLPQPSALAIYSACAAWFFLGARNRAALIYALPILLCMDNLFCGTAGQSAPVVGLASAALSLAGFGAAILVSRATARMAFVKPNREVVWAFRIMRITALWARIVGQSSYPRPYASLRPAHFPMRTDTVFSTITT